MLRSVTLGLVLSILAAACALVEPAPPGTSLQISVRNSMGPVVLTVTTPNGDLAGAVRPASLPAGTTTEATFDVPAGDWWIAVNGSRDIRGTDFSAPIRNGCQLGISLHADGVHEAGCR